MSTSEQVISIKLATTVGYFVHVLDGDFENMYYGLTISFQSHKDFEKKKDFCVYSPTWPKRTFLEQQSRTNTQLHTHTETLGHLY